jgi:hypothetical protein
MVITEIKPGYYEAKVNYHNGFTTLYGPDRLDLIMTLIQEKYENTSR